MQHIEVAGEPHGQGVIRRQYLIKWHLTLNSLHVRLEIGDLELGDALHRSHQRFIGCLEVVGSEDTEYDFTEEDRANEGFLVLDLTQRCQDLLDHVTEETIEVLFFFLG